MWQRGRKRQDCAPAWGLCWGQKGEPLGRGRSVAAGLRGQCTAVPLVMGEVGSQLRPEETRSPTPLLHFQKLQLWYCRLKRKQSPRSTAKKEREGQEGRTPGPACPCGSCCCSPGCCCQVGLRGPQGLKVHTGPAREDKEVLVWQQHSCSPVSPQVAGQ